MTVTGKTAKDKVKVTANFQTETVITGNGKRIK